MKLAQYLLRQNAFLAFCMKDEILQIIAQDFILEEARLYCHLPTYYIEDEKDLLEWAEVREGLKGEINRNIAQLLIKYTHCSDAARRDRRLMRLFTLRKIDSIFTGSETFHPNPELGGEPYLQFPVSSDQLTQIIDPVWHTLTIHKLQYIKHGRNSSVNFGLIGKENLILMKALFSSEDLIVTIENVLFPFTTKNPDEWELIAQKIRAARPLKSFETSWKLPAFPTTIVVDPNSLPEGFRFRLPKDWILEKGVTWGLLAQVGLTPLISEAAHRYVESNEVALENILKDPHGLVDWHAHRIFGNSPLDQSHSTDGS